MLGIEWQKMENPDLRKAMEMKPDQKGVRVRRIEPTGPEFEFLKSSDIILSFDGVDIANDGTGKAIISWYEQPLVSDVEQSLIFIAVDGSYLKNNRAGM